MSAYPNKNDLLSYPITLSRGSRAESRFTQLPLHAVFNPVRIPPFHRVHHPSVHQHREVQMVAARQPRHPTSPDRLALGDGVAHLDVKRRQMSVKRLNAHAVVDDDAVAVD